VNGSRKVPIGDVVESTKTWNPLRSASDEVFNYIDLSAIDQDSKLIVGVREVSCKEAPSRARQLVGKGDIIVSTVRPNLNGVAQVPEYLDGATASTGFCILRPRSSLIDGRFLFHWVKSPIFIADMVNKATGASYPAVSDRIVLESILPLPSLEEQKRIADILDHAESLRAKRKAALAQFDELIQSIYFDLFGDPESNPKKFHISALAEIIQLRGGFAFKSNDYVNEGIPLVRIGEVNRGNVAKENACFLPYEYKDTYSQFIVKPGDMLMSLTGTTGKDDYGNVILLNDTFDLYFLNQRVALFQSDENVLDKYYLLYFLRHPKVKIKLTAKSRGIRQANISNGDVLELKIPLPPLSLQKEFARRVESIEKLKTTHKASLAELEELFASLQYRAFRGELSTTSKANEQSFEGVKI